MENRILDYMNKYGYITTKQAFEDLGCSRLSEYIRRLRLQYEIDDVIETGTNRYGEKVHWKKYFIRGNKDEKYN